MKLQQLHEGKGSSTIEFNKYVQLYEYSSSKKKVYSEKDVEDLIKVGAELITSGFEFSMNEQPPSPGTAGNFMQPVMQRRNLKIVLPLVHSSGGIKYTASRGAVGVAYQNYFKQMSSLRSITIHDLLALNLDDLEEAIDKLVESQRLDWEANKVFEKMGLK